MKFSYLIFLPYLGSCSILLFIFGIYNITGNFTAIKDSSKIIIENVKDVSESYAKKSKTVIKAEELGVKLTASNYIAIFSISLLVGIVVSIMFKNIFIVIIGFILGYMIPETLIENIKIKRQKQLLNSSIPSVEIIAIENMQTNNITKAIIDALPKMKEPFKSEMEDVIRDVNSGKFTLDEALDIMVIRTRSKHLRKVANSLKYADKIGGNGVEMLQNDANLLHKDKARLERAEIRLKKSKRNSYIGSLILLLPFVFIRFSLPDIYYTVMNIWLGQIMFFIVLLRILFSFHFISKKGKSIIF